MPLAQAPWAVDEEEPHPPRHRARGADGPDNRRAVRLGALGRARLAQCVTCAIGLRRCECAYGSSARGIRLLEQAMLWDRDPR